MQFTIRDMLCWTLMAGIALFLFSVIGPIPTLLLCIPLLMICFVIASLKDAKRNDMGAIAGAVTGVVLAIILGNFTDIGLIALSFRPDLPPQEFKVMFGVMTSAVVLAFIGAIIGAVVGRLRQRRPGTPLS